VDKGAKRMPKGAGGSILGAVGGVLIGAAIVFFVGTIVLNNLKAINVYGSGATAITNWAAANVTINQIITFLSVATILLSVLGIVMVGAMIIRYISGSFGG
jgi:hypothetical protein